MKGLVAFLWILFWLSLGYTLAWVLWHFGFLNVAGLEQVMFFNPVGSGIVALITGAIAWMFRD